MRRKYRILLWVLLCQIPAPMFGQFITLNEMVSNSNGAYLDEDGDPSDWIELHNPTAQTISLNGYALSDDGTDLGKWNLPNVDIEAGSYLVIFCSDKDRYTEPYHTNFKIRSEGEPILLSYSGTVVSEIAPTPLAEGFALANLCQNGCYWEVMSSQSPGESNHLQSVVTFSQPSGVFENDFELSLSNPMGHEIRYTMDGSIPTAASALYSAPLELSDATYTNPEISNISTSTYWSAPTGDVLQINVIRAQAYLAGIPTSQVFSKTYAVGTEAAELFAQCPVFSFQIPADSLFDHNRGIHVQGVHYSSNNSIWSGNYFQRGRDWEREAHIEYFENQAPIWAQGVGIRIHGGRTRGAPQKSFRLYARNEFGAGEFHHQFFDTKEKTVFDKLLLRCHFGCWNKTIIKDELTSYVCRDLDFESQHSQPCVVFINGEYWGMFSIRDFIDAQYIEEEYGFHQDSVDILNHGSGFREGVAPDWGIFEGENDHYAAMMDFMENADMSDPNDYAYIGMQMNINSMIEYYSTQVYFAQKDWPAGNHKVWRGGTEGTSWEWILFDSDAGWGLLGPSNNSMVRVTAENSTHYSNPPWATYLFRRMLESPFFVEAFKERLACLMKNEFDHDTIVPAIDRFVDLYEPGMDRNLARWHFVSSTSTWLSLVDSKLHDFSEARRPYMEQHITDFFGVPFDPEDYDCGDVFTSVDGLEGVDPIAVYPNPSKDHVWVDYDARGDQSLLRIFDGMGREVFQSAHNFHQKVDISQYSPGMYVVVLEHAANKVTSKFLKL